MVSAQLIESVPVNTIANLTNNEGEHRESPIVNDVWSSASLYVVKAGLLQLGQRADGTSG
jgi:hypothetical protein